MLDIHSQRDSDIRSICKERIEALEHWLRRLIDEILTSAYGDYFSHVQIDGSRLIRKRLSDVIDLRRSADANTYPRKIDALLLHEVIDIVCNEHLFKQHFRHPLQLAFPDGHVEARTFMLRLIEPRNRLSHSNVISVRQAEQVVCYTNDVIESIKKFYADTGMQQEFNVPLILKFTDSFGGSYTRNQCIAGVDGGIFMQFNNRKECILRPGDCLSVAVDVDPSFDSKQYQIAWTSTSHNGSISNEARMTIPITNRQVGVMFDLHCQVTTNHDWHRMQLGIDDRLVLMYKVLPLYGAR